MKTQVVLQLAGTRTTWKADLIGDDTVSGGSGGWEDVERGTGKKRRMVMGYGSAPAYQVQIPLILDGIGYGRTRPSSVEAACRVIQSWGRPLRGSDKPPVVLIKEGPLRAPPGLKWIVEEIDWGRQMRNETGNRILQELTITLSQYRKSRAPGPASASKSRTGKGKSANSKKPANKG